jgi:hypothetical protein
MTIDELKSLRKGELVVFTKIDEKITDYHNHQVGDEMTFIEIEEAYKIGSSVPCIFICFFALRNRDVVNFLRKSEPSYELDTISHFSYEICHYIERKTKLIRDKKLNDLGL